MGNFEVIAGDNWFKKQFRRFIIFCDSWFIKYMLRPIIFLLPPMVASTVATKSGLRKEVIEILGPALGELFNTSGLVIIVGAYLYIVLMKAGFAGIRSYSKPARALKINDLLAVFRALSIVVSDKSKRMSSCARSLIVNTEKRLTKSEIFEEITKPDQQIPLLVKGLMSVLEYLDESNAKFRAGLMRVVKGKAVEWYAFEPINSPPRTTIEDLNAPTSTISRCIRKKQLVIVEDIQKELIKKKKDDRSYVKGSTQPNDEGSQLCYPIIHATTHEVEYVICIATNKAESFKCKHAELYEWILDHFDMRISMEHSLLILKEYAYEKATA